MDVEPRNTPEPPEDADTVVEYVGGGEGEEETYEEAWQVVNEKTLRGWRLQGMEEDPAGDGVKLTWDAPGGHHGQG